MALKLNGMSAAQIRALRKPPILVNLSDSTGVTPGNGVTFPTMAMQILGQKMRLVYNAGVTGNTTAQMLARVQTDVIAYAPSYCIVLGGTNDVGAGTARATTAANLQAIYDALLAAGITPIACTITPRNAAAEVADVRDLNLWVKGNAAIKGYPCVDLNSALVAPDTSYYNATYNADTVHPNNAGAAAMAQAFADMVNSGGLGAPQALSLVPWEWSAAAFTASSEYSQQFVRNPLFVDTDSDGVPDNWTLSSGGGAAITKSCVTDPRFVGRAWKWVATASTGFHTGKHGLNANSWSVGDKLRLVFKMAVESPSIGAGAGIIAKLSATGGTSTFALNQWSGAINIGTFYLDHTVSTGTTALEVQLDAQLGGGSATIYWGQVGVINLTRLGLTALP